MTVMGERLPEAWMVEWHRNGRVEFPLRRWSFMQFPMLLVLPVAVMGASGVPDMLDSGWRVLAYLLITMYAALVVGLIWQLVTQRPILVIDHRGIHQGRRRLMPWDEIGSIGPVSGSKMAGQLPVHPKNVWAKNLVLTQQHVNDLQTLQAWLTELLTTHRETTTT
ncbi:hypothetical protein EV649_3114 [Kribbella sp. VKM Ac-2569]|uniref:hypothetical protein n=1 Tax=Kribbella sp. VKM Ac-2569 TaxID=2512220 RepID=UPI00102B0092|nr:hypothetical protein [Kribbella sp. VKM Ac-2569]RZT19974.1 hypothetical protein EV649_3114 [Kribbella sp. VKM Ac-2569]